MLEIVDRLSFNQKFFKTSVCCQRIIESLFCHTVNRANEVAIILERFHRFSYLTAKKVNVIVDNLWQRNDFFGLNIVFDDNGVNGLFFKINVLRMKERHFNVKMFRHVSHCKRHTPTRQKRPLPAHNPYANGLRRLFGRFI